MLQFIKTLEKREEKKLAAEAEKKMKDLSLAIQGLVGLCETKSQKQGVIDLLNKGLFDYFSLDNSHKLGFCIMKYSDSIISETGFTKRELPKRMEFTLDKLDNMEKDRDYYREKYKKLSEEKQKQAKKVNKNRNFPGSGIFSFGSDLDNLGEEIEVDNVNIGLDFIEAISKAKKEAAEEKAYTTFGIDMAEGEDTSIVRVTKRINNKYGVPFFPSLEELNGVEIGLDATKEDKVRNFFSFFRKKPSKGGFVKHNLSKNG